MLLGLRIPPTDTLCNRFALGECLDEIVADEAMMWTVTWSLSRECGRCRASLAPKARRLPEAGKPSVVLGAGRASFRQLSRQPEPRDDTGDQRQQTAGADRDMQAGEEAWSYPVDESTTTVALADNRVFSTLIDGRLIALEE